MAVEAEDRFFRRIGVGVVAFVAVRFQYRRVKEGIIYLYLMTCFACCRFLDDGKKSYLKGAVGIMAFVTFVSKDNRTVFSTFLFRMAFQAQVRNTVDELVFKFRAVGIVAVVTTLFGRRMIMSSIQNPRVTVQADRSVNWRGKVGIVAALAFCIAHRGVLVFGFDDIQMARCAGRFKHSLFKQPAVRGGMGIVAPGAVCSDDDLAVPAGVLIVVALEA